MFVWGNTSKKALGHDKGLELYYAVNGKMWEDELPRARLAKEQAGLRQGRSFRKVGKPSVRNMLKAATGGSRAAVFKRIRAGGCKTRASLANQLSYINDKADFSYSTMTNVMSDNPILSEGQKDKIIDAWSESWRGTSKLGFTSHMLLSFPTDVSGEQVRDIALEWCEHFFESGLYGDEWDYVMSVHTDRDHPHAHIVLNNRGNDLGEWFSCWAGGVMSPQLMREKQAEIAEKHGIVLDATSRLERGIFTKAAGLEEIYAAKAEGRKPQEITLNEKEQAIAKAEIVAFAKEYKGFADVLKKQHQNQLSKAAMLAAKALENGKQVTSDKGEIDMSQLDQIKTIGDAMEHASNQIENSQKLAKSLTEPERSQYEIKAAPAIASLGEFVADPELRVSYNQQLANSYPPHSNEFDKTRMAADSLYKEGVDEALAYGRSIGLNIEATLSRMEAGGTKNHGLAQEWVKRDVSDILEKEGLTLEGATGAQQQAALDKLDNFQIKLGAEMGYSAESAFNPIDEGDKVVTHERSSLDAIKQFGRDVREAAERSELVNALNDDMKANLVGALQKELGDDGMVALERGDTRPLASILPSEFERLAVTQEYLKLAAKDLKAPELEDVARDLQGDKITALANERAAEQKRTLGNQNSLDDDMGF